MAGTVDRPAGGANGARWYDGFFEGIALDLWRQAIPTEQTIADVEWLMRSLATSPGAQLLDVPCGNGRHAVPLAERGMRVTGVDLSDEFVAEARGRAQTAGVEVEILRADMVELPERGPFDGAYCMGNSFGYTPHEETLSFLEKLAGMMKTGARFCLETGMSAESILPEFVGNRWVRVADILLLVDHRYDSEQSRLETEYTFVRDGKSETRHASHAIYTVAEIRRFLAGAGLLTRSIAGSTDGDPFEPGCQRLLLVAEKE